MLIINKYSSNMFYDIKIKILFSIVHGKLYYKKKRMHSLDIMGENNFKNKV